MRAVALHEAKPAALCPLLELHQARCMRLMRQLDASASVCIIFDNLEWEQGC
jgi:hypothetical protein